MVRLMRTQAFHALEYDGITYDCGDKIGLLRANVAFALVHPDPCRSGARRHCGASRDLSAARGNCPPMETITDIR